MKVFNLLLIVILITGCTPSPFLGYNASSSLETLILKKFSHLQLIINEENNSVSTLEKYSFNSIGVFYAFDEPGINYIVVSPLNNKESFEKIRWYQLELSSVLKSNEVDDLVKFLEGVIESWDIVLDDKTGKFASFSISPVKDTRILDNSTISHIPKFRIDYQRLSDSGILKVIIKNDYMVFERLTRNKLEVKSLLDRLKIAKSMFK